MCDVPIVKPMPPFMTMTPRSTHRMRTLASALTLTLGLSSSALWAADAPTTSNSCDQFKTVLMGRMDPSIRGYSMETMPSKAPVPPGGKVIGTCEGGAIKIVYFRSGAPQPLADSTTVATKPAATPPAAPAVPKASAPALAAVKPAVEPATELSTAPPQVAAVAAPEIAPEPALEHSYFSLNIDVMAGLWKWLLAFTALALAGGAWAWWTHHNAFDAAGLPRGPRL